MGALVHLAIGLLSIAIAFWILRHLYEDCGGMRDEDGRFIYDENDKIVRDLRPYKVKRWQQLLIWAVGLMLGSVSLLFLLVMVLTVWMICDTSDYCFVADNKIIDWLKKEA